MSVQKRLSNISVHIFYWLNCEYVGMHYKLKYEKLKEFIDNQEQIGYSYISQPEQNIFNEHGHRIFKCQIYL